MRAKAFRGMVLLVTSNELLKDRLQRVLVQAGYGIRIVRSQEDGFKVVQDINPAILVVDRCESGFSRLHHEMPLHPPIVTVTYHATACDERHCAMDIEDGAARAVCNASPAMIVALLGSVLRRQQWEQSVSERYFVEGVTIDLQSYAVTVSGTAVHMKPTEFRILKSLLSAPGYFLSRSALLDQVWGEGFAISPHTLDVHIFKIRQKLVSHGVRPDFILTVRGLGFKLQSKPSPVEALTIRPYRSATPGIGHPSFRPHQIRPHAVNAIEFGGSPWRHKSDRRVSARHRIKPVYHGDQ